MNVLLFLTDQQRAVQHFPPGWPARNLPGVTRLQQHGLTFERAFTNACMCSPARSTLMSGYFPAQHGVKYTLETDMPAPEYPQVELATSFKNPATVVAAAGYTPVYKGKFHCNKPANGTTWVPNDVNKYGFTRWDPPDAGANQDVPEEGGGIYDNDGRFMNSQGTPEAGTEGALQYLSSRPPDQPFFMVVSLVNPHDVLFYPKTYTEGGYDDSWLTGEIEPPATADENLSTKPTVQEQFLRLFNASGPIPTPQMKRNYLNFYGNLMRSSDAYLVKLLDTLAATGLLKNTLVIATADHGEMGTAHGGLRQKNFNFYEESTRVPLVYSNPRLFPRPRTSDALVSHVDFLPRSPVSSTLRSRPARPGRESTIPNTSSAPPPPRRRTTPSSRTTTGSPARPRAPTRSPPTMSSRSANSATSSPATTTPTDASPTSGRCTTSGRSAGACQPRVPGPPAHAGAGARIHAAAAQACAGRTDASAAAGLSLRPAVRPEISDRHALRRFVRLALVAPGQVLVNPGARAAPRTVGGLGGIESATCRGHA